MSVDPIRNARDDLVAFGNRLVTARCEHAVKLRELTEITGIRTDLLSQIENARVCASPGEAKILTDWLLQHPVSDSHATLHEGSCRDYQRSYSYRAGKTPTTGF